MFFARLASFALFSTAAMVSAAPLAARADISATVDASVIARHDIASSVTDALNTLLQTTNTVLPQITALSGSLTDDAVAPLLQQLNGALSTAVTTLSAVSPTATKRHGTGDEVAQLLGGLLNNVADTLNPVLAELQQLPVVSGLLTDLDPLLNNVLTTVEGLIPGVLALVSGLVNTVTGLLGSLGLGSVLGSLGL